jgi:hypothetical protein
MYVYGSLFLLYLMCSFSFNEDVDVNNLSKYL